MLAIGMILAIGLTSAAEDPVGLVERLGSPRYAERQRASQTLSELGREALPALREARQSRDPEVRSQAAALVEAIEGRLLVEATEVPLDFDDRPLGEVVQALSERSGMRLHLFPDNPATWKERRVRLVADAPVPFWSAMTELCRAGGLAYQFASGPFGIGREPGSGLRLMPGGQEVAPYSDSGPFRATLTSIHHSRERNLMMPRAGGPARPAALPKAAQGLPPLPGMGGMPSPGGFHEDFHVQMQVVAEPRLTMALEGTPRVIEAVDDRDQSLVVDPPGGPNQRYAGYSFGYATPAESSMIQCPLPLKYPAEPGKFIRRIRVGMAVQVAARRPDPVILPIAEAKGQSIRNSELVVEVQGAKPDANGGRMVELTIRSLAEPVAPVPGAPPGLPRYNGPDAYRNPLEFVDDQDRPVAWYPASLHGGPEAMHLSIQFLPQDQADPRPQGVGAREDPPHEMNRLPRRAGPGVRRYPHAPTRREGRLAARPGPRRRS
ncbi:MAG: hypothetical protein U0800_10385 [Isosphaeraceae bacterium]